jgi:phage I-like protein
MIDPDKLSDECRSKNIHDGVRIIICKEKNSDKWPIQTYRFDASKFTATEAQDWLKKNKITPIDFEEAAQSAKIVAKLPEDSVPVEFQILPYGAVALADDKPILVDEAAMESVIADFRAKQEDLVIDYEHQTETGAEAPAAGWIKNIIARGKDGLWVVVEWTERAREYLRAKEYRYYSPVFKYNKMDRRLLSIERLALTNAPRFLALKPIVAKNKTEGQIRKEEKNKMDLLNALIELLGLDAAATAEQVVAAVKALQGKATETEASKATEKIVAAKAVLDALALKTDATESEVVASILALRQSDGLAAEVAKQKMEIEELRAEAAKRKAAELVRTALAAGKITPAQTDWATEYAKSDPAGFEIFAAKAPAIVPLGTRSAAAKATPPANDSLDEDQRRINRMMGISDESWKKFGPRPEV